MGEGKCRIRNAEFKNLKMRDGKRSGGKRREAGRVWGNWGN
jgi:hypothetical protein